MTLGRRCDRVSRSNGAGIEGDWLRRIGPAHFAHINFRGAFSLSANRYANVMLERAAGKGAAKPVQ